MTRATTKRPLDPTTIPRQPSRPVKPPRIRTAPQVKPHKVPVTVENISRAVPGSNVRQVVSRITMDMPRPPQVKAHQSPVRTGKTKARPNQPSMTIVVGLSMPEVPQVKPHPKSEAAS